MIAATPSPASFDAIFGEMRALLSRHFVLLSAFVATIAGIGWAETEYLGQDLFLPDIASWLLGPFLILRFESETGRGRASAALITVVLTYFGAMIITTLGVLIGFVLLIVPGIYWSSCWLITAQLVIIEGQSVRDAMSESWRLTQPSRGTVTAAMVLPWIGAVLAMLLAEAMDSYFNIDRTFYVNAFEALAQALFSAFAWVVSHACYRVILPRFDAVSNVFD